MATDLLLSVLDINEVIKVFDRIKVFRADSRDGVYAEVTTPATRPILVAGQMQYQFTDPSATPSSWFCSDFYHATTQAESSRSEPHQGQCDGALSVLSVERLQNDYLFGLPMKDRQGNPLPRSVYETGIRTGVAWMERKLGISIAPRIIAGERHDYRYDRERNYMLVNLDHVPVRSVQSYKIVWPGQRPGGTVGFPKDWINLSPMDGSIEVVPSSTFGAFLGPIYPLIDAYGSPISGVRDYIPGIVQVDYVAGFPEGRVPADVLDLVAKASALQPLSIGGDFLSPLGVSSSSVSIDGLGQSLGRIASASGNAYAARMNGYMQQLQADIPQIRSAYRGATLRVV